MKLRPGSTGFIFRRVTLPLHLHAGDCAAEVARLSGPAGEVVAWRDSAAVGPCSRERGRHLLARMAFWGVARGEIQRSEELPDDRERVLWFGPDPWEQLQLVEVLANMSEGPCSIVPLASSVTAMTRVELAAAYEARRPAGSLRYFMAALWFDYCDQDRAGLELRIRRASTDPRLPHLAAALRRIQQDRLERRTQREVEALVRAGVREVPDLLVALRARELPTHGAWYGDTIVGRLRDAALTAASSRT